MSGPWIGSQRCEVQDVANGPAQSTRGTQSTAVATALGAVARDELRVLGNVLGNLADKGPAVVEDPELQAEPSGEDLAWSQQQQQRWLWQQMQQQMQYGNFVPNHMLGAGFLPTFWEG